MKGKKNEKKKGKRYLQEFLHVLTSKKQCIKLTEITRDNLT